MTRLICKGPKVTVVEGDVEDAEGEGTASSRGQLMRRRLNKLLFVALSLRDWVICVVGLGMFGSCSV